MTKWNTEGMIVEARAYLDSNLVASAIALNELGLYTYSDPRDMITEYVTLAAEELVEASGLRNATE